MSRSLLQIKKILNQIFKLIIDLRQSPVLMEQAFTVPDFSSIVFAAPLINGVILKGFKSSKNLMTLLFESRNKTSIGYRIQNV